MNSADLLRLARKRCLTKRDKELISKAFHDFAGLIRRRSDGTTYLVNPLNLGAWFELDPAEISAKLVETLGLSIAKPRATTRRNQSRTRATRAQPPRRK